MAKAKKKAKKPKKSSKGSYGTDKKGNKVSANSKSAVSVTSNGKTTKVDNSKPKTPAPDPKKKVDTKPLTTSPSTSTLKLGTGTAGSYKGYAIDKGSDSDISARIREIDNIGKTPKTPVEDVKEKAQDMAEMMYESGYDVNPDIEDFDLVSVEDFMKQANDLVDPYYKQRFDTVLSDLKTSFERVGQDFSKFETDTQRSLTESKREGLETLAGRGLAFSSRRDKFETDITDEATRVIENKREEIARSSQDILGQAEGALGTDYLRSQALPMTVAGRSLKFSDTPLTGTEVYNRTDETRTLARQLADQENLRRQEQYNSHLRQLSFQ